MMWAGLLFFVFFSVTFLHHFRFVLMFRLNPGPVLLIGLFDTNQLRLTMMSLVFLCINRIITIVITTAIDDRAQITCIQ